MDWMYSMPEYAESNFDLSFNEMIYYCFEIENNIDIRRGTRSETNA